MNAPAEAAVLDRSTYLGSSDAAAILGVSKWATPVDVWRRKVHPETIEEDPDKAKIFRRGRLMEPVIREMAAEDYGLEIVAANRRYPDPEHDWMRAEIDFETEEDGAIVNADCKSVSPFMAHEWGEEGTNEIPIEYHAQFQFGMMVTGRARCDVYALFGTDQLVRYVVHRDEETIAAMREKCIRFWHEHVLAKVPPSPVRIEDVMFLMSRTRGRPVAADPDTLERIEHYKVCKGQLKIYEAQADEHKFHILDAMRRGAEAQFGQPLAPDEDACLVDEDGKPLVTWKKQSAERIDVGALREKKADIAAQFTVTSTTRVLRVVKPAKKSK